MSSRRSSIDTLKRKTKREYRIHVPGVGIWFGKFETEAAARKSGERVARKAVRNTGGQPPIVMVKLVTK